MAKKERDPLADIPPACVVRQFLVESERKSQRLRVLLELAEKVEAAGGVAVIEAGRPGAPVQQTDGECS
jgi:hypothetical protein